MLALEPLGRVVEAAGHAVATRRTAWVLSRAAEPQTGTGRVVILPVNGDGRAGGAADVVPERVAHVLVGEALADDDRVAGAVGGAGDRRVADPPVIEIAPQDPVVGVGPPEAVPAEPRLTRRQHRAIGQADVGLPRKRDRDARVVVAIAAGIVRNRDFVRALAGERILGRGPERELRIIAAVGVAVA